MQYVLIARGFHRTGPSGRDASYTLGPSAADISNFAFSFTYSNATLTGYKPGARCRSLQAIYSLWPRSTYDEVCFYNNDETTLNLTRRML